MNPAIIIPCYKRNFSLERLLDSIARAHFPNEEITLIISIDGPVNEGVKAVANNFKWDFGDKRVVIHGEHLGLKRHIFSCSAFVDEFEHVIILEDDLIVSPYFYMYALSAGSFYQNESKLAGISLYNYQISEFSNQPFIPIDDGSDCYFLQLPSSWGQLFNKSQWNKFINWLTLHESIEGAKIPQPVKRWGIHSWKKHFIHYLIDQDLYFVYPRLSLTTNFEEIGVHAETNGKFQSNMQQALRNYHFLNFDESRSVYDAWFEMKTIALNKWTNKFKNYSYEVDLAGTKEHLTADYVLTSRASQNSLFSFSGDMYPVLQNVIADIEGSSIRFTQKDLIINDEIRLDDQQRIFIVIPVVELELDHLRKSLQSIINCSYTNCTLVISASSKIFKEVLSFIETEFQILRFRIHLFESSYNDLSLCLRDGFDQLKGGIAACLHPGLEISGELLGEVNQVFQRFMMINGLLVTTSFEHLDDYRINKEVIPHVLHNGHGKIDLELVFYRATFWKEMDAKLKHGTLNDSNFFSQFIIALLSTIDVNTLVTSFDLSSFKSSFFTGSTNKTDTLQMMKQFTKADVSNKMRSGLIYGILRWFSKRRIPLLQNFYYLYYDLPLVVRSDQKTGGYYLFKK